MHIPIISLFKNEYSSIDEPEYKCLYSYAFGTKRHNVTCDDNLDDMILIYCCPNDYCGANLQVIFATHNEL